MTYSATPNRCKRCGYDYAMLTPATRVEHHERLLALLSHVNWMVPVTDYPLVEESPPYVIGFAQAYAARLVAADQGLCANCVEYLAPSTVKP
jgi:hypothetical protein